MKTTTSTTQPNNPAEVLRALDALAQAVRKAASAITPLDAAPGEDVNGGTVGSLTEAVMGVTSSLQNIAAAIDEGLTYLGECIREGR